MIRERIPPAPAYSADCSRLARSQNREFLPFERRMGGLHGSGVDRVSIQLAIQVQYWYVLHTVPFHEVSRARLPRTFRRLLSDRAAFMLSALVRSARQSGPIPCFIFLYCRGAPRPARARRLPSVASTHWLEEHSRNYDESSSSRISRAREKCDREKRSL